MKALSVKDPFATEIATGEKTIEFRSWKTSHRGDLLICCGARPSSAHSGKAICIVTLADCRKTTQADVEDCVNDDGSPYVLDPADPGYSWVLANPRLIEPFPVKGQLSLFEVTLPEGRRRQG